MSVIKVRYNYRTIAHHWSIIIFGFVSALYFCIFLPNPQLALVFPWETSAKPVVMIAIHVSSIFVSSEWGSNERKSSGIHAMNSSADTGLDTSRSEFSWRVYTTCGRHARGTTTISSWFARSNRIKVHFPRWIWWIDILHFDATERPRQTCSGFVANRYATQFPSSGGGGKTTRVCWTMVQHELYVEIAINLLNLSYLIFALLPRALYHRNTYTRHRNQRELLLFFSLSRLFVK